MRGSDANHRMVLHDMLEGRGIDTLLAHPTRIKAIVGAGPKGDRMDPAILADLLRVGMVHGSFVPDRHYRDLRSLSSDGMDLAGVSAGRKNRITATVAKYDYVQPAKKRFAKRWIAALRSAEAPGIGRMSPGAQPAVIGAADRHRDTMERRIAPTCSDDPGAKLPVAVPGINHTTAPGTTPEMAGIGRFRTGEKLAVYAGIVPSHRNSGGKVRNDSMAGTVPARLRRALVNTATVAVRHDGRMRERYLRIAKRGGRKKAKVTVANTAPGGSQETKTASCSWRPRGQIVTARAQT